MKFSWLFSLKDMSTLILKYICFLLLDVFVVPGEINYYFFAVPGEINVMVFFNFFHNFFQIKMSDKKSPIRFPENVLSVHLMCL
jgi:hypothetical protein